MVQHSQARSNAVGAFVYHTFSTQAVSRARAASTANLTDAQLIRAVNEELLATDLKHAAEKGCLPSELLRAKSGAVATGPRGAMLLQVTGKLGECLGNSISMRNILTSVKKSLDMGVSAQTQLDVLEARKAARSTVNGAALLEQEASEADIRNKGASSYVASSTATNGANASAAEEDDHMAEFNAAEEAASLPATVFPRSMLQLELSDGFTVVKAFEHRRIDAISMASTPLGAKLLLRNARFVNGQLLLSPDCVSYKGGRVDDMDRDAEDRLIDQIRLKLGKEPIRRDSSNRESGQQGTHGRGNADAANQAAQASGRQPPDQDQAEGQWSEDEAIFAEMHGTLSRDSGAEDRPQRRRRNAQSPTEGAAADSSTARAPPGGPSRDAAGSTRRADGQTSRYFSTSTTAGKVQGRPEVAPQGKKEERVADFVMLDANDVANPIVLSDSE